MTDTSLHPKNRKRSRPPLFRRALVLPAEHGSWSWLLVPYLVGAAVGGSLSLSVLLVLTGGLSAFLMRQPATAWLRIRQGKGRQSDAALATGWTLLFASIAVASLLGLLALGQGALLWLLVPLSALLFLYLSVARIHRAGVRSLWMEVAGAVGLAAMAPAAYIASRGHLDVTAWLLWLLLALQNVEGVLYVRLRLSDRRGRTMRRDLVFWAHLAGLLLLLTIAGLAPLPWLALLPFLVFLVRAAWAVASPRPLENVKRFGFTEVAVELASGLWLIATYLYLG